MTIAAFDFDGTITRRDTFIPFILKSKGIANFSLGMMLLSPIFALYFLKILPNYKAKEIVFRHFFKGMAYEDFQQKCNLFSTYIDKITKPEALESINKYKLEEHKVIIISASIENWILPWAQKNNIEMVLGTAIEVDNNGIITGKFRTKNCYGKEKVTRLLEAFPNRSEYGLIAFGDSSGDKELLSFADKGFFRKFE